MHWRTPHPPPWPTEEVTYLAALTPDDWGKIVGAIIMVCGGGITYVAHLIWSKWEASNARALVASRKELADEKISREECTADLEAERADRTKSRERNQADNDRLQGIVNSLRTVILERDATIAGLHATIVELNSEIHLRDTSIAQNTRNIDRLSQAVIKLSDALLVIQGDMRPRTVT